MNYFWLQSQSSISSLSHKTVIWIHTQSTGQSQHIWCSFFLVWEYSFIYLLFSKTCFRVSLIKVYWILLWQKEGRDLVIWGEKQTRGEDEPILPNTWTVMRGDSEKLKSIFHKELWGSGHKLCFSVAQPTYPLSSHSSFRFPQPISGNHQPVFYVIIYSTYYI